MGMLGDFLGELFDFGHVDGTINARAKSDSELESDTGGGGSDVRYKVCTNVNCKQRWNMDPDICPRCGGRLVIKKE